MCRHLSPILTRKRLITCWRVILKSMQAFDPALHSLLKERLKQACKMPDRTHFLLFMADAPAFESDMIRKRLIICWRVISKSMQAFAPALHSVIKARLKQACKMPDRTHFLLFMADAPAFESDMIRKRLITCWRVISKSMQAFDPALHSLIKA